MGRWVCLVLNFTYPLCSPILIIFFFVNSQAKLFLQNFHQTRISASAKLVEDEQWNPAEVTPELQHIANIIVDSAVRDPPDLLLDNNATLFTPLPAAASSFSVATPTPTPTTATAMDGALSPTTPAGGPPSAAHAHTQPHSDALRAAHGHSTKHLRIEERSYFAVSATASMLGLLLDYLRVVVNLPLLTPDTMGRVIEFLKAFNSRTCQVVLGAGAMRSAGLKNITAKHLGTWYFPVYFSTCGCERGMCLLKFFVLFHSGPFSPGIAVVVNRV